jgi:hypothetical protein
MRSNVFNVKQVAYAFVLMLACSCMRTTPALNVNVMTDQDLNRMLVTENRSLDSVKHILKLDRTSGQIVAWRIIRWLYGQWRLARVVFSRAIR